MKHGITDACTLGHLTDEWDFIPTPSITPCPVLQHVYTSLSDVTVRFIWMPVAKGHSDVRTVPSVLTFHLAVV